MWNPSHLGAGNLWVVAILACNIFFFILVMENGPQHILAEKETPSSSWGSSCLWSLESPAGPLFLVVLSIILWAQPCAIARETPRGFKDHFSTIRKPLKKVGVTEPHRGHVSSPKPSEPQGGGWLWSCDVRFEFQQCNFCLCALVLYFPSLPMG